MFYLELVKKQIEKSKMSVQAIANNRGLYYETLLRVLNGQRPIPRNNNGIRQYIECLRIPQGERDDFRLSAEIGQRRIPDWVDIEKYEKEIMEFFRRVKKNGVK